MQTLRSFVDTVWAKDRKVYKPGPDSPREPTDDNPYWSKPDSESHNLELHRLTTPTDVAGRRTDFFEFYWADIMQGTLTEHLLAWVYGLLMRRPWPPYVPWNVYLAWLMLWIVSLAALIFAIHATGYLPFIEHIPVVGFLFSKPYLSVGLVILAGFFFRRFVVPYFGDVARYVRADPANIGKRREVRHRGLRLLETLHQKDGNGNQKYDRIIVVSHSLGSIVAYDLLNFFWSEYYDQIELKPGSKLAQQVDKLERLAEQAHIGGDFDLTTYRSAQREFAKLARELPKPWLITDFVTLGSPLTHAEFLLARFEKEFERRKSDREIPTCPPWPESLIENHKPVCRITYEYPEGSGSWYPHHSTVFLPVRWTNIHAHDLLTSLTVFLGDVISGPVRQHFGRGVLDIRVDIKNRLRLFSHTEYWTWKKRFAGREPRHIEKLRQAVNLLDKSEPDATNELSG